MKEQSIWMERMEDFTQKVFRLLREDCRISMKDAISTAAKQPTNKFYVDLCTAARFVSVIDRGEELPLKNKNKIAMYKELQRRWVIYRQQQRTAGRTVITYKELMEVIKQPAPCFYQDVETLNAAFYKYLRTKRN